MMLNVIEQKKPKSKFRVLIVDDEPDLCHLLAELLKSLYDVEAIMDAHSALASIDRTLPDLIITDVRMPGLSGLELLKRIRESSRTRRIPVILISGNYDEESISQAYELGANYLTKPFSAEALRIAVAAHFLPA